MAIQGEILRQIDVVLVQPRANRFDSAALRMPGGLMSISAFLDREGYKIKILDSRKEKDWENQLKDLLKSKPLCVGLSAATGRMIHYALEVSKLVKEMDKDIPVVWGGMHPTLVPETTIAHPLVDIIITGEADATFTDLVHALDKGKPLNDVAGIWFKTADGKTVKTSERKMIEDLDTIPRMPYHLVDVKAYSSIDFRGLPSMDLTTSRGCPYRCTFCYLTAFNHQRWRAWSVKRTLEEIQYLIDTFGVRDLYFTDDNFATDLNRMKQIMQGMIDNKWDLMWGTQGTRMDTLARMDDSMLELMDKSGCGEISVGVESGSQRILDLMKKDTTLGLYVDMSKRLAKYKFVKKYNCILGFPTETIDEMKTTIKLALDMAKQDPNAWFPFNIYAPYPGTPMFALAVEHGFNTPKDLEGWIHLEPVGWQQYYNNWFTPEINKFMQNVNFTSYFAFKSTKQKITNKFGRMLFDLYHPVARFRFNHSFYALPIESKIATKLLEV